MPPPHDSPVKSQLITFHSKVAATDPNVATSKSDSGFVETHLRPCPTEALKRVRRKKLIGRLIADIGKASNETAMYAPLAALLSEISKTVFATCISNNKSKKGQRRFQNELEIEFVNHSSCPLSQFPVGNPQIKPDVVGVFKLPPNQHFLLHEDGTCREVPCHRVETIVEAKTERDRAKALPQAGSYIYHMLQGRPDRPGYYGLTVTPKYFKVLYGSPIGFVTSNLIPWTEIDKLCAYIYSLYDPPVGHILYDRTITWQEPKASLFGAPSWTITVEEHIYRGAELIFLGYPFGRRTTIFRVRRDGFPPVIIKEYYLDSGRRFEESDLLSHIHAEGFVPGVVRAVSAETVESDGEAIVFRNPSNSATRTKRRIVLADAGVDLEYAKSVNDILKAAYDALEIHRTVAKHRRVLHRDMSLFNILMYPTSCQTEGGKWWPFLPPLIEEILTGERGEPDKRKFSALMIDFDHSAKLDDSDNVVEVFEELQYRTGTPVYIARAVGASCEVPSAKTLQYKKMPSLTEEARSLYIKMHGEDRYNQYCDDPHDSTYHGGKRPPFDDVDDLAEIAKKIPFYHRWQYDAESVFWTLYSVLLRVRPAGGVETESSARSLRRDWKTLTSHTIPGKEDLTAGYRDPRSELLDCGKAVFVTGFLPEMQDVAELLLLMSKQVLPSYALLTPPPPFEDHLHEALQRLILNYLVAHRDTPIPLTPGVLRSVTDVQETDGREAGAYGEKLPTAVQSKKRTHEQSQGPSRQSARLAGSSELTRHREDDPPPLMKRWNGTGSASDSSTRV
ncbi:hypothetical protein GY45DRAFT_1261007 [Cubamyces sp. BRFM 1775]|nr:hypothetical protein GY45DRAFT_1261007 [Cubamyces sp. BRFM 1775]